MTLVLVYAPAFYASGDYKTPSWAATGAMAMNASLNAFLVGVMGMGAASVAVATSASALLNFLWLAKCMKKKRTEKADKSYGVIVPTMLACAATMIFQWGYEEMSIPLNIAERVDHLFAMTTIQRGVSLALGCLVFSSTFFAATRIVNVPAPVPDLSSKS
jgi:peptidoglycan biosynthesis protein MviN/MurJ (putative lipid II flippase)